MLSDEAPLLVCVGELVGVVEVVELGLDWVGCFELFLDAAEWAM